MEIQAIFPAVSELEKLRLRFWIEVVRLSVGFRASRIFCNVRRVVSLKASALTSQATYYGRRILFVGRAENPFEKVCQITQIVHL